MKSCLLFLLALLGLTASPYALYSDGDAWVFVDSAVGDTRLTGQNKVLRQDALFPANGARLETGANSFLGLFLSNGLTLYMDANSAMRINALSIRADGQAMGARDVEAHISKLDIELERGVFVFSRPLPRPSSILHIKTPAGEIDSHSNLLVVQLEGGTSKAFVLSGSIQVLNPRDQRRVFVRDEQWVDMARLQQGHHSETVGNLRAPEMDMLEPLLLRAQHTAGRMWFDPASPSPVPLRIIAPEYFSQPAYNEYRMR